MEQNAVAILPQYNTVSETDQFTNRIFCVSIMSTKKHILL